MGSMGSVVVVEAFPGRQLLLGIYTVASVFLACISPLSARLAATGVDGSDLARLNSL